MISFNTWKYLNSRLLGDSQLSADSPWYKYDVLRRPSSVLNLFLSSSDRIKKWCSETSFVFCTMSSSSFSGEEGLSPEKSSRLVVMAVHFMPGI